MTAFHTEEWVAIAMFMLTCIGGIVTLVWNAGRMRASQDVLATKVGHLANSVDGLSDTIAGIDAKVTDNQSRLTRVETILNHGQGGNNE